MAASITDIQTLINDESLSDQFVQNALDDAAIFLPTYGVGTNHTDYDILHKYYTAHILFSSGQIKLTSSESVGDVSASYDNSHMQINETGDPYLKKFLILLGQRDVYTSI